MSSITMVNRIATRITNGLRAINYYVTIKYLYDLRQKIMRAILQQSTKQVVSAVGATQL